MEDALIPTAHVPFKNDAGLLTSSWPPDALVVLGDHSEPILTITHEGRIVVKPDAPADETAREVCRLLSQHVVPAGELLAASRLMRDKLRGQGWADDDRRLAFERLDRAVSACGD